MVPNVVERRSPEETRARILEVAWDLIRELGARATIADVADRLGMSSANVYRFYPSKQALSEAVAISQLGAIIAEG
ncbi:MAG: helix-turn-helix domain-containing protein, partial [Roseiarcus sp.]